MGKGLKIALKILLVILCIFLIFTFIWFAWSRTAYSEYCDGMSQNAFSNIIVPRYFKNDEQYTYFVKYPGFLSTTGNLAVSAIDDAAAVQAFLIWPSLFGEETYGLLIADETGSYQIYTDNCGNPTDESFRIITDRYSDDIANIVSAAKNVWKR